jgi:hypothetical protein
VSGKFFRNTATGIRITTKSMVDYNAIHKLLTEKNPHFFTLYTKANKHFVAVISYFPGNNSAEDISVVLQVIHYVIEV